MQRHRLSTAHLLVPRRVPRRRGHRAAGPRRARRRRAGARPLPGGPYFVIGCGVSHMNNDDPIVLPGKPGASHHHTYIGNRTVDAHSTPASLLGGESSCEDIGDASAYWVPTLRRRPGAAAARRRRLLRAPDRRTGAAFRRAEDHRRQLAGDSSACALRRRLGLRRFGAPPKSAVIPSCPPDRALHLRATFPGCWNGRDLDSADHQRHMAYATGGRCPARTRSRCRRSCSSSSTPRRSDGGWSRPRGAGRTPTSSTAGTRTRSRRWWRP